jgi:hypothetical protein
MTARMTRFRRICAAAVGGASLLITGCSGGAGTTAGSSAAMHSASAERPAAVPAPAGNPAAGARLTALPPVSPQSIIYTASLTVRTAHVAAAAARAARLAGAAGGYVSSEQLTARKGHPAISASLVLKVPVAAYPAALAALAKLGTPLSQSQHAQDVTQTVADVTSRVASAQAAITQLRALLRRAGTVNGLLAVQDQINGEEAGLEALQAQQRALARETTYATIAVKLTGNPARSVQHHHREGGFTAGLTAGWRALRLTVSWLLAGAGAVLPFAVPGALLIGLGYRARRWRARRGPVAGAGPGAGQAK